MPDRADSVYDLETLAPLLDEFGNDFGRVLEIAVDHDNGLAPGALQAGRDGHLVTEVTRELEDADSLVGLVKVIEKGT